MAFRVPAPDFASGGQADVRFDNALDHVISGDDVIAFVHLTLFQQVIFAELKLPS